MKLRSPVGSSSAAAAAESFNFEYSLHFLLPGTFI